MPKKNARTTRKRIVSAAWKLFYEQGYENTTVEDIIELSQTSKGSFYHYFDGKDALLSSLSDLFDERYQELIEQLTPEMTSREKMLYLNQELFSTIENSVPLELLARLLSSQLVTRGEKHLLDRSRLYFRLLRKIAAEGIAAGEIRPELSPNEVVKIYALCERALMYDWCICNGEYSLKSYGASTMPAFLSQLFVK